MDHQAKAIRHYLLDHVSNHPNDIVAITSKKFHVTRTTIHRHLRYLIKQGLILKSGTTRAIQYHPKSSLIRTISYSITPDLSEFSALKNDFEDIFQSFHENIYDIGMYGFTEIFNNAIDHSNGSKITVSTDYKQDHLIIKIEDNGIGIFKKIRDYFQLKDIRESILQLSKGKTTTDLSRHTGEGIFFTSRAFDRFEIHANNLNYFRDNQEHDWGLETLTTLKKGTIVSMTIHRHSTRQLIDIFKQYQDTETLSFNRTEILVKLSQLSHEPLISRSQAKRIITGLEKFNHIILDFSGVRLVGQGFVDEMFRVFANAHSDMVIEYIHANPDVTFMIKRSLA